MKFCDKLKYLRNWISGGFETWKSTRVLRCAQYSGFRRSHVHGPWVVFVGLVHGILEVNFGFRYVNGRLSCWNQFNMACRDGFWKTRLVKQYCSMVVGAKFVESWADFFGWKFSHFWSVLERLSIVCVFLLSSPRCDCVVSDGASISFWKIFCQKFKRLSGLAHGHENLKNWWKN